MNTVKQKLIDMLIACGMFESQAKAIFELAQPVLDKQAAEMNVVKRGQEKTGPEDSCKITWDAPFYDYPEGLYAVWFISIKPVALAWIDDNKPQAWFREMFVS